MKERGSGRVDGQEFTTQRNALHKEQGSYRKDRSTNTPLVSPVKQSEVLNPSTSEQPLRDLGAQLEVVGTLFGAEINQGATALRTLLDVDIEHPLEQPGPAQAGWCRGMGRVSVNLCSAGCVDRRAGKARGDRLPVKTGIGAPRME
jgi:hypothetical protein